MDDKTAVAKQLGRTAKTASKTVSRCAAGFPLVTQSASVAADGTPFPTLYWLTCPQLRKEVSRLEASGLISAFERELKDDPGMAALLKKSDDKYRSARAGAPGPTPIDFPGGIGGNRDLGRVKCLHAHTADYLAAGVNPIGRRLAALCPVPTDCSYCEAL